MADAAKADEALARGEPLGVLHGLPVAHKDLVDTAGIRTTRGSPFYRDNVPTRDALIVTRIRAAGAITRRQDQHAGVRRRLADVQHRLRRDAQSLRPRARPAAAAAAAPRWRSPAAWCRSPTAATPAARCATPPRSATSSGFRPSPGRVPSESTIVVAARRCPARWRASVADVALFLSAIAGPDPRNPLSHRRGRRAFPRAARAGLQGRARRVVARPRRHSRSSRRSAASSTPTAGSSRISAASSKRPSRTSPASTRRFRCCATPRNYAQYAPLVRQRPEWVKDTIKFEVARGRAADRRRCRPRAGAAGADVRAEPAVLRALRLLRPAGDAGGAVRRDDAVSDRRSPARRWRPTSTGCARAGT